MKFVEFTELVIQPNPDRKTANVSELKTLIAKSAVIALTPTVVPRQIQTPIPKIGTLIALAGKAVLVGDSVKEVLAILGCEVENAS